MQDTKNIVIEEVIGHMVAASFITNGMFGKARVSKEGRIIYSIDNQSLFFLPKGARSKGYTLEHEDIESVILIRKDSKKHKEYLHVYINRQELINEQSKRKEEQNKLFWEQQKQLRQEQQKYFEQKRQQEREATQKEISEVESLGGYDELKQEAHSLYQDLYNGDFYNESFLSDVVLPIVNKLIHKSINSVNDYPKHYFDKKRNKGFCKLIENKINIKLKNTQKGNVEILNNYLMD